MTARRVSAHDDSIDRCAVTRSLAHEPQHCATTLVDNGRDGDERTQIVIEDGNGDALFDERRGHERKVRLVERAPITAVNEHERPDRPRAGTKRSSVSLGPGP